ncbi:hypothetical protein [Williamwhitmania taraxaci]|uniref:ABC-2 family transporter protein n=1 Tax=Williamwhitmania taraxaci TaxID=1640674 RepID=A0A1G6PPC4_9BACT|nr:hypothetical protein [Williamwhitmania taraxaci]SDC81237.1 hypothetical protein SAMN05216323_105310 [Williamwhitmania taraxaci]
MRRWLTLLEIEWLKAKSFYAFSISIAAQLFVFLAIIFVGSNIDLNIQGVSAHPFFEFPHIWTSFAWLLSWISLFTAFAMLVIVGAEFGERTYHFQLANGLKRFELLGAKVLLAISLSLFWALVLFVVTLLFGAYYSNTVSLNDVYHGVEVSLFFFLHTFFLLAIALIISFLIRNTALSVLAFVVLMPLEVVIRTFLPDFVRFFFPFRALQNLAPMPDFFGLAVMNNPELAALKSTVAEVFAPIVSIWITVVVAVLYSLFSIIIIFFSLRKRSF